MTRTEDEKKLVTGPELLLLLELSSFEVISSLGLELAADVEVVGLELVEDETM